MSGPIQVSENSQTIRPSGSFTEYVESPPVQPSGVLAAYLLNVPSGSTVVSTLRTESGRSTHERAVSGSTLSTFVVNVFGLLSASAEWMSSSVQVVTRVATMGYAKSGTVISPPASGWRTVWMLGYFASVPVFPVGDQTTTADLRLASLVVSTISVEQYPQLASPEFLTARKSW
ncbi:hypothetical protein O7622_15440 [Micromonospora sp. WMMD1076]|uniref:hypothetical protein n=1 Tax=Micromonospora sp. WMMD1076 TaxID=3016103 RepID=UPI00249A2B3B|nr:hypothetical protein [Micromonospora sp. WMMD1076]WFF09844.1 hypothetical protein O7622_15440 [Micromonospora sp. WMMD1076]